MPCSCRSFSVSFFSSSQTIKKQPLSFFESIFIICCGCFDEAAVGSAEKLINAQNNKELINKIERKIVNMIFLFFKAKRTGAIFLKAKL
jgi:hypothetical protein